MKSRMKKEFVILGLIIVLLIAYLLFKGKGKMHYKAPELDTLKIENIDKIDIKSKDQAIVLVKKDDKWVIDPKGYPIDPQKLENITKTVLDLKLSELISKKKNYKLYDLTDEKGIKVKVFNKEKAVRDFLVGKRSGTYGHTFVKIKDDDNVYHARGSFRSHFSVKPGDLRDKSVLKFDPNEISEVSVQKGEENFVFAKKVKSPTPPPAKDEKDKKDDKDKKAEKKTPEPPKPEEISWLTADGKQGDKAKLNSLVNQLMNLSCQDFIEGKTKDDFKALVPLYTVQLKGSKDYELKIYPGKVEKKPGDAENKKPSKYPVLSSMNPYPFTLSSYKADQIMKAPGDFVVKTETPAKKFPPAVKPKPKTKAKPKAAKPASKPVKKKQEPKKKEENKKINKKK